MFAWPARGISQQDAPTRMIEVNARSLCSMILYRMSEADRAVSARKVALWLGVGKKIDTTFWTVGAESAFSRFWHVICFHSGRKNGS